MMKLKKTFHWHGLDHNHELQQGSLTAKNLHEARLQLIANEIHPLNITKIKNKILSKKNIKPSDITHFLQQLTTLLKSNIPLQKALTLCHDVNHQSKLASTLSQLQQDIQQGLPLSKALSHHPALFDDVLLSLIKVGEQTGHLHIVLEKTIQLRQQLQTSKAKIKKALTYPCTIVAVSIIVSLLMLLFIIPQFEQIFSDFGAALPPMTQFILTIANGIKRHSLLLALSLTLIVFSSITSYRHIPAMQLLLHRWQLNTPLLATLLNHAYQSHLYYLLAMTTLSQLTLPDALQLVAKNLANRCYQLACQDMFDSIITGQPFHQSMLSTQRFPKMDCDMIAIAEESGQLSNMLQHLSDYHQQQVDNLIDNLGNLLEPCMMIIIGLIIGGLVVTMYLPIFNMGNMIS